MKPLVSSAANVVLQQTLARREAEMVAAHIDPIDYRSIIESTLAGLAQNTPAARQKIYAFARTELDRQLRLMALPQPIVERETLALDLAIGSIEGQQQALRGVAIPLAVSAAQSADWDRNLFAPHQSNWAGLRSTFARAFASIRSAPATPRRASAPLREAPRIELPRSRPVRDDFVVRKVLRWMTPRARFWPIGLAIGLPLGVVAIALAIVSRDGAAFRAIVEGPSGRWFPSPDIAIGEAVPPAPSKAPDRLLTGGERSPAEDPQTYYGPTVIRPIRAEFSIALAQPVATGAQAEAPAAADTHIAASSEAAGLPAWSVDYAGTGAIFAQTAQNPVGGQPPNFAMAMAIPAAPPVLATQPAAPTSREVLQPASASAKPWRQADAKIAALIDSGKRALAKAELERAVGIFTEAIRLDPKYPEGYVERGQANFRLGEPDRAIADYSAAIQRDPQFGNAFRARGMAYLYRGSSDLALTDLSRAIALAESDVQLMSPVDLFYARRSRASIYNSKHQYDREIADYTALVQSYMRDAALVESLKANYGDAGAANMLATIYRQRALAALHLSDPESAIADLTDAIPLSSDRGYSALVDRARIHESRGERAQAIADLQAALDVRPGSDEARLGLKRLGASPSPGARPGL